MAPFIKFVAALLFALAACTCSLGQTQDIQALGEQVARLLDYPARRIVIIEERAKNVGKHKDQVIAIYRCKSVDDTFAPVTIAFAKQGALVTPEMDARWREFTATSVERRSLVRRFELGEGAYGYAGIGMAGPGGSEELVIATWPARRIDFQVKISIAREGVTYSEATREYFDLINQSGPFSLSERLVKIVELLQSHARLANLGAAQDR